MSVTLEGDRSLKPTSSVLGSRLLIEQTLKTGYDVGATGCRAIGRWPSLRAD
jgi:hypothetical protein